MLQKFIPLLGRVLLALIFMFSGAHKITHFSATATSMAVHGLPLPKALLVATLFIELGGGLMLLLGWHARWAALAIFLFLIPSTLIFHAFWSVDPSNAQLLSSQSNQFMKNLAIMGAMLYVFAFGPGSYSVKKSP